MPSPPDATTWIKETFIREELPVKSLLVKEGTLAKKMFYIDKGCCRAWFNNDGKDVTYQFLFEGSFASDFAITVAPKPSWYSIEALETLVVYSIGIDEFRNKLEQFPGVKAGYYRYLESRLDAYQQLFVSRIKDNPEKRYRDVLARHPEIIQRVPQHYIASFLGITSVSLSRIRNRK